MVKGVKIWIAEVHDSDVIGLRYGHESARAAVEEYLIREQSVPDDQYSGGEAKWVPAGIEGGYTMTYRTRHGRQYNAYVYPMAVLD